MSYQTIDTLTNDGQFQGRVRACAVQESETFIDSNTPDIVSAAKDVLQGGSNVVLALQRMIAAAPGVADGVDNGDGTVDQTQVTDGEILSGVQHFMPAAAGLYFDDSGKPIG